MPHQCLLQCEIAMNQNLTMIDHIGGRFVNNLLKTVFKQVIINDKEKTKFFVKSL